MMFASPATRKLSMYIRRLSMNRTPRIGNVFTYSPSTAWLNGFRPDTYSPTTPLFSPGVSRRNTATLRASSGVGSSPCDCRNARPSAALPLNFSTAWFSTRFRCFSRRSACTSAPPLMLLFPLLLLLMSAASMHRSSVVSSERMMSRARACRLVSVPPRGKAAL